ncbi:MAG: peroxidase [Micrococcales bacterium]|nr:MAG: peroxidase [Micrococcales bacterium]
MIAFDLRGDAGIEGLRRTLQLWTDSARRLSQGEPSLADPEPELVQAAHGITITVGIGLEGLRKAGLQDRAPAWLKPLPDFAIDALQPQWSGGDLVVQIGCNDQMALSHATRIIITDVGPFAVPRWRQTGFRTHGEDAKNRNLMGQIDGVGNPPETDRDVLVWCGEEAPDWLAGGSSMVVRRIEMNLASWAALDRPGRDQTIGRTQATGTPLSGGDVHTTPDLKATDDNGLLAIPLFAHVRRANTGTDGGRILRRPYNYDVSPDDPQQVSESGLVFIAFQADVERQFVPIQKRLDELDLLNKWTTPIGSAVFAILPGVAPGEIFGQALVGAPG